VPEDPLELLELLLEDDEEVFSTFWPAALTTYQSAPNACMFWPLVSPALVSPEKK
jgi:hypothetical protein